MTTAPRPTAAGRSLLPHLPLTLILAAYVFLGVQYAALTPAWQVPDEPAHYNVIRQIAATGALPRLEPGDYDQAALAAMTGQGFPADLPLAGLQYQDYQPPLYYLLAAPIYQATGGSLLALRLFSLALGAGAVVFTYLAAAEAAGPGSALPALAAGFTAFIPQHLAMLAGVNNDSLAELLIALGLWWTLRRDRTGAPHGWAAGIVLGLAFLTKVQAYLLAPVILAGIGLAARRAGRAGWRQSLAEAGRVLGLALGLGALYWLRNWSVCGPWDFVCGRWHNQVVVGQPTTAEWIAQFGWWGSQASLANRFLTFTFQSFWGQFGWMAVVMDRRVYLALVVYCAGLAAGCLGAARSRRSWSAHTRSSVWLLSLAAALAAGVYIYYNTEFVQHQGRYLFPALVPLSVAAGAGLRQWARWLRALAGRVAPAGRAAAWLEAGLPAAALAMMAGLSLFALYRFLLPALR